MTHFITTLKPGKELCGHACDWFADTGINHVFNPVHKVHGTGHGYSIGSSHASEVPIGSGPTVMFVGARLGIGQFPRLVFHTLGDKLDLARAPACQLPSPTDSDVYELCACHTTKGGFATWEKHDMNYTARFDLERLGDRVPLYDVKAYTKDECEYWEMTSIVNIGDLVYASQRARVKIYACDGSAIGEYTRYYASHVSRITVCACSAIVVASSPDNYYVQIMDRGTSRFADIGDDLYWAGVIDAMPYEHPCAPTMLIAGSTKVRALAYDARREKTTALLDRAETIGRLSVSGQPVIVLSRDETTYSFC